MQFVDTHAHIYLPEFKEDLVEIIQQASNRQIQKILLPNIDLESYTDMMQVVDTYPVKCMPMLGLHPCSVKENWEEELKVLFANFAPNTFYAIGEIGLDLYWDKTTFDWQSAALKWQCEFALAHQLPVALHTRNATLETLEIIQPYAEKGLKGVFHCFGEDLEIGKQIVDLGFYIGIGGVLTFKKSGLDLVLPHIPIENIVLETDSPYLAPVPFRGKRNQPAYIFEIAQKLAEVKMLSMQKVAEATSANAYRLFNLV